MSISVDGEYPRPQFVRKSWLCLNGVWDFAFDDEQKGMGSEWFKQFPQDTAKIIVPFTYETKASGIGDEAGHDHVWYRRNFGVSSAMLKDRLILHFEGSDFSTAVWVNGCLAGVHRGGYTRFSFDITHLVREGSNELTVKVDDSFDMQQPRGKQRWLKNNFGCWYVQTTGIWKTVWLETVPAVSLADVRITPDVQRYAVRFDYEVSASHPLSGADIEICAEVSFNGNCISRCTSSLYDGKGSAEVSVFCADRKDFEWAVQLWTPETPNLYDVAFTVLYKGVVMDMVSSYFGMREIRIDGDNILLNGRPLYQRLILDQGYWKDSHLTPPDGKALENDVDAIKSFGYNGVRKHQKIEDERFLYWCDAKGLLVWSEMAAAYRYTEAAAAEFTREWLDVVAQNYNHPCVITWVPFNESWGLAQIKTDRAQQHFTESIYHLTKAIDRTRPVIVNDGWEHTVSDIITLHDYEEAGEILRKRYTEYRKEILAGEVYHCSSKSAFADGYSYKGQPVIISEFGGIAFDNDDSGWGYGSKAGSEDAFIRRFDGITTAVKELPYVCGFCYTQLADVQQEINGLLSEDRKAKIQPEIIKEINERKTGCRRSYM